MLRGGAALSGLAQFSIGNPGLRFAAAWAIDFCAFGAVQAIKCKIDHNAEGFGMAVCRSCVRDQMQMDYNRPSLRAPVAVSAKGAEVESPGRLRANGPRRGLGFR